MNEVKIGRVYKHFKGDYYIVNDIGINTETNEKCVIYRGLYGEGPIYIRPISMFLSPVDKKKYPNIKQEFRFELQEIESVKK